MDRVSLYYYSVVNSSHQVVDFVCDLTFVLTFDIRVHMMINPGRDSLETQQSHLPMDVNTSYAFTRTVSCVAKYGSRGVEVKGFHWLIART